jgi:hypothetical protein
MEEKKKMGEERKTYYSALNLIPNSPVILPRACCKYGTK